MQPNGPGGRVRVGLKTVPNKWAYALLGSRQGGGDKSNREKQMTIPSRGGKGRQKEEDLMPVRHNGNALQVTHRGTTMLMEGKGDYLGKKQGKKIEKPGLGRDKEKGA